MPGSGAQTAASVPPIDARQPAKVETATFALGCFWAPDALFGVRPGVVRTRVGYSGGTTKSPSYHRLGDHTETVQMDYDPTVVSYRDLLQLFWDSHAPTRMPTSLQYMSIVFYQDDEQRKLAAEGKRRVRATTGKDVFTEIRRLNEFYRAEAYHQKYHLRQVPDLTKEFAAFYPNNRDFTDSTAVARVNGYLAGYGSVAGLEEELADLGLSAAGRRTLLDRVAALHGQAR